MEDYESSVADLIGPEPPGVVDGMTHAERIEEFLRLLGQGCTVRQASAAVAVPFSIMYRRRAQDPEFAKRWEDARRVKVSHLVAEAERRALRGSDKLLMFLLTNYAPDRFKKHSSLDVTNSDGSLSATDADRASRMAGILETARIRKASKAVEDLL